MWDGVPLTAVHSALPLLFTCFLLAHSFNFQGNWSSILSFSFYLLSCSNNSRPAITKPGWYRKKTHQTDTRCAKTWSSAVSNLESGEWTNMSTAIRSWTRPKIVNHSITDGCVEWTYSDWILCDVLVIIEVRPYGDRRNFWVYLVKSNEVAFNKTSDNRTSVMIDINEDKSIENITDIQ